MYVRKAITSHNTVFTLRAFALGPDRSRRSEEAEPAGHICKTNLAARTGVMDGFADPISPLSLSTSRTQERYPKFMHVLITILMR